MCYICGGGVYAIEKGTSALTPNYPVIYIGGRTFIVCRKHHRLNKHLHYNNYATDSRTFNEIKRDSKIKI